MPYAIVSWESAVELGKIQVDYFKCMLVSMTALFLTLRYI